MSTEPIELPDPLPPKWSQPLSGESGQRVLTGGVQTSGGEMHFEGTHADVDSKGDILEMYDHLPPYVAVFQAWTIAGPNPLAYGRMRQELRDRWPVLARALDRMAGERNG